VLYNAFISYSHAADGKLAPTLQRALHNFAKPWYKRRSLRVFRDKTSLSANPALWPAIESALSESEWFLYMASPQASQSHWVRKELNWWLEHRTSNKLLILLSEGELNWDGRTQDFDWNRTTAVPTTLRGQFADEPLYVDLRWARAEENLSLRHSQFRGAILDVAAPLHGKAKDELDGEDVRQHRKNKAWAWSAGSALFILTIVAIIAALYAAQQRNEAIAQRDEAVRQRDLAQGRQLRVEAQRLGVVDSQWATAVLLAIESLRRTQDANSYELLWTLTAAGAKPVTRATVKAGGAPVVFSPDGRLIATGDEDMLVVFQARSGQEALRIPFGQWARFIGFSAAGDQIVAAGSDAVRVFDLTAGREIARLDDGSRGAVFGFSPDGQIFGIASGTQTKVIEVFTQRLLSTVEHSDPVKNLIISPDGKRVALVSERRATLIDTATGRQLALPERRTAISMITFSADGKLATIASYGEKEKEEVIVVDVASGQERDRLAPGSSNAWSSKHGNLLVTQPEYATLLVRDLDKGMDLARIKLLDSVGVVDWSHDGELLVVGTGERDGSTSVFQTGSWRRLARLKHQGTVRVESVAVSPNGDLIASRANRTITVFAAHQDVPLGHLREPGGPTPVAFSADGKIVAGVFDRNTVLAFAAGTHDPLARLDYCEKARILTVSADGKLLAAGCYDGMARIVEVATGRVVSEIPHRYTTPLAFSPDGKLIFSVTPEGATVFEVMGGREVRALRGDSVTAVAFSPTGKHVVVAIGGSRSAVFETFNQTKPRPLTAGDSPELLESVAFSPDGKRLAVGVRGKSVRLYNAETWQPVAELHHRDEEKEVFQVRSVVFNADGTLLASVTENPTLPEKERVATLRVFDVRSAKEVMRVPLHGGAPLFIGFSPDGAFLEIVVGERHLRRERFPLRVEGLIEDACSRVSRNLTEEEWVRYFGDIPYRQTCSELNPAAAEIQ